MKWIKSIEEDLVNLDLVEFMYIRDRGEHCAFRFQVIADNPHRDYIISEYKNESEAREFLDKLFKELT